MSFIVTMEGLQRRESERQNQRESKNEGGKDHAVLFDGDKGTVAFNDSLVSPGFLQEDV